MSADVLTGAVALGLVWGIVTIGVWITFRILDIADLTVEGSIVTGASVTAICLVNGINPALSLVFSLLAGAGAGLITALLHTKLKIPALLAGILTNIGLYSINIRIMADTSNIPLLGKKTLIQSAMEVMGEKNLSTIALAGIIIVLVVILCYWFLQTPYGSSVRATGNNPAMAKAQGINIDKAKIAGLMISNALVGLGGGLLAQYQGYSDVQMGVGAIVIGLASLIIGEVIFGKRGTVRSLIAITLGAVLYRIIIALVIQAGMRATDLKLFTAITVAIALYAPVALAQVKNLRARIRRRSDAHM